MAHLQAAWSFVCLLSYGVFGRVINAQISTPFEIVLVVLPVIETAKKTAVKK